MAVCCFVGEPLSPEPASCPVSHTHDVLASNTVLKPVMVPMLLGPAHSSYGAVQPNDGVV